MFITEREILDYRIVCGVIYVSMHLEDTLPL
jgi:hypothetical protein